MSSRPRIRVFPFTPEEVADAEAAVEGIREGLTTQQLLDRLTWDHDGEDPDHADSYLIPELRNAAGTRHDSWTRS